MLQRSAVKLKMTSEDKLKELMKITDLTIANGNPAKTSRKREDYLGLKNLLYFERNA